MISRGSQGQSPLLLELQSTMGGFCPPPIFIYWLFSKCIDLASKVFCMAMVNIAMLHGYRIYQVSCIGHQTHAFEQFLTLKHK